MQYSLNKIAEITNGKLIGQSDLLVTSIDFDSRNINAGAIFVPIKAERDGHDFIQAAADNGAIVSFVERQVDVDIPQIIVKDTQRAFWDLAKDYLNQVDPTRVAISGSNGKTTTKDLVSAVLGSQYLIHHTIGSFNNELGVPKTILEMPEDTQIIVLEIGMDRPGQLHDLSNLINPDIAILTMIGEAHIEFFKTRDKIADAKMEIVDGMDEHGIFLINGDEPLLLERAGFFSGSIFTFGQNPDNSFEVTDINPQSNGLFFKVNDSQFHVHMLGRFNALNAASAIAVGDIFNLSEEEIQTGLDQLLLTQNRLTILEGSNGQKIISDVYNSNPTAAVEAVKILNDFQTDGKRYLVLGDMLELGELSIEQHQRLIEPINNSNIDEVYLIGSIFPQISSQLTKNVHTYQKAELQKLSADLENAVEPNDLMLLKGSHGIHLEKVLANLID
ncbi:MAG: UDP-N-acetylmuramoyl-tripeptide--D-alanyl-D-alanine ligase [Lactobacillaceae bacterium]|jgi:UDP-N-acetylmuramoyl-tripeptide--D-alanyl-D-alanine ligase|nr:UDP-N-acetylmuramoyl-tripeptide--D-alanyl-D-alanine ligase [Lactobacillaceae bacterium]